MADKPLLSVSIKEPEKTLFDGFAKAISSVSNRGKFDVLPFHENFISLIQEAITVHKDGKEESLLIPIKTGVLKVQKNVVKILLGIETKAKK